MAFLGLSESEQEEAIHDRTITICVIGLGKMGLPLAMVFTHAGYRVNGLDISETLVKELNDGITDINEPKVADRLKQAVDRGIFHATVDIRDAISPADFIILIIPVLTQSDGHADTTILQETFKKITPYLKDGVIIIQESTLPPGTTSDVLKPIIELSGKKSGHNFGIVFAPERTSSTRAIYDIEEAYPKLVGGDTPNATTAAAKLYESVCQQGVIQLSSARAAEAVKTFKGAYRDANIAIANELAILADKFGVDILEIVRAMNSEPSAHLHTPGIGVGGHCIPVYPQFLIALGRDFEYEASLLDRARLTNDKMVDYAVDNLSQHSKLQGKEVLVLGIAYRNAIKEYRMSPTLRIVPLLRSRGSLPRVMDPLYNQQEIDELFGEGTGLDWTKEKVRDYDAVIICTDHDEFKLLDLEFSTGAVVFDGRYVIKKNERITLLQPGRLNIH